ncbi:MAG: radical SAM protein [bacterium]|nr:radical SAM protein [bacterium]
MAVRDAHGWREGAYLDANPDVKAAVAQGIVHDGYHHYLLMGRFEGRRGGGFDREPAATTKLCFDPWENAEFNLDGSLKPCCIFLHGVGTADGLGMDAGREAPLFRDLRHRLLTGDLGPECARCHIRPTVPAQKFVEALYPRLPGSKNLLDSGKLDRVRVDVTQKCNLRCVYCALSVEGAPAGTHMEASVLERVGRFILEHPGISDAAINGHGETTHHPHWREFCEGLLDGGAPLSIITNLGRVYDEAEIATLSRFRVIQVSIDMADEELLRRIRRKVELGRILTNMALIRARALRDGRRLPVFSFSCGLYDKSIVRLEEFAALAVAMSVHIVTFWDLMKYPDLPGAENVRPLAALDGEELRHGLACFDRALAILTKYRVEVQVAGGFVDRLRERTGCAAGTA